MELCTVHYNEIKEAFVTLFKFFVQIESELQKKHMVEL